MYASNKYEREMMRVPQNYSGNAFSSARQRESVTERPADDMPVVGDMEEQSVVPPQQEETEASAAPDAERTMLTSQENAGIKAPEATAERSVPAQHSTPGLFRMGLGQEEMMLLGLLYLLRSEGERGHNDELVWLLLLLLIMG